MDILTMGEILVEIMREKEGVSLKEIGVFKGPYPSGAPAIFIDVASRLGADTCIIGGVGKDDFGKCILDRLKRDDVDTSFVSINDSISTGCAFVTYFDDGSREFIYHMGNSAAINFPMPELSKIPISKYFHIMGCSLMADEMFAENIIELMHFQRSRGAKVTFDPNIRKELLSNSKISEMLDEVLKETSIFLPGKSELLEIIGEISVDKAIEKCFTYENMEIVALKNGSKGTTIYQKNKEPIQISVYPAEEIDPTGAGDAFDAAFITGLSKGKSVEESGNMAAIVGAINVTAFGPMEAEIDQGKVEYF